MNYSTEGRRYIKFVGIKKLGFLIGIFFSLLFFFRMLIF